MATFKFGSIVSVGHRPTMEDTISTAPAFLTLTTSDGAETVVYDFFAVFDGHGGAWASSVCRSRMHAVVKEEALRSPPPSAAGEEAEWWRGVMERSFERVDAEVVGSAARKPRRRTAGTTAVVVLVGKVKVVVANCGDSRAVLYRSSGEVLALTTDHKPERVDELKRIKDAGGEVIDWNGFRVQGILATSRAIGDQYLKPFVIADPEVTVIDRTSEDEFLILASDGLWDVMSNEGAGHIARYCLTGEAEINNSDFGNRGRADMAAIMLAKIAISEGSTDNVAVIVVQLKNLEAEEKAPI